MSGPTLGCEWIRSTLPALIGDEESGVDRAAVYAHLRACPGCRGEYGAYVRAERALQRLAALPEPRPGFFAELERATVAAVPPPPARRWEPARPRVIGWWVAAACFLGGVAVPVLLDWTMAPAAVGAGLKSMPLASRSGHAERAGQLQRLSYPSRHRGLRGQLQTERSPWGDPQPPRPK